MTDSQTDSDTETETCDHPTAQDEPCQHPVTDDGDPDRCWIDAHNETATPEAGDPGRPSKLSDRRDDVIEAAKAGMSVEGCARMAGVGKSTLYDWLNQFEDFSDAFARARARGELEHVKNADDRGSQFLLERSFGYTKSQEIEHSGGVDLGLSDEEADALDEMFGDEE